MQAHWLPVALSAGQITPPSAIHYCLSICMLFSCPSHVTWRSLLHHMSSHFRWHVLLLCIKIYSNVYYYPDVDSQSQTVIICCHPYLYSIMNLTVYGHSSMGCMESVESFECFATLGWIMWLIPELLVLPLLIIDQQFWEWGSMSARVQVRHLLDPSSPFADNSCWFRLLAELPDELRYDKKNPTVISVLYIIIT